MADDTVQLTDLEVIQQFSLAVRGATAPRRDVIAALEADLAYLSAPRKAASAPKSDAAPEQVKAPAKPALVAKPATKPAAEAPTKKVAAKAPVKAPAKKAPATKATRARKG